MHATSAVRLGLFVALLLAPAGVIAAPAATASATAAPSTSTSNQGAVAAVSAAEIDAAIARLGDPNPLLRKTAARSIAEAPPDAVMVLEPRLLRAPEANPGPMWQALERARKVVPKDADDLALLDAVAIESGSATNRSLALLLAGIHACEKQGGVAGARVVVRLAVAHKSTVKGPAKAALERMGDHAVAALIEARHAEDKDLRTFANKLLDGMGKYLPSDAVSVHDPQSLAEVLTAFGKTKDPDAARVLVSYLNADRAPVREAARASIAQLGDAGRAALKDAYETFSNEKAPDDWSAERLLKELLAAYDRVRLAEVFKLLDEGTAHRDAGRLEQAVAAYDALLARAPSFERRAELASAYVDLARKKEPSDRKTARALFAKAARLAANTPLGASIESELLVIDAQDQADQGIVDTSLLERAVALDPSNQRARDLLHKLQGDAMARTAFLKRIAMAVGAGTLATLLAIMFVGRKKSSAPPESPRRPARAL